MWRVETTDIFGGAILLCAGKKRGQSKRFYDEMIPLADRAYRTHLRQLDEGD